MKTDTKINILFSLSKTIVSITKVPDEYIDGFECSKIFRILCCVKWYIESGKD